MKLVLAEKKELAEVIAKAFKKIKNENYSLDGSGTFFKFDSGLLITWTSGHILKTMPAKAYNPSYEKWKLEDLPYQLFPLKHEPDERKLKQFSSIKKLVSEAEEIIHAGDPDDEGQLLIDEVLIYLNYKKPVKRLLINDMNIEPIINEIKNNLKDNRDFKGLYNKALSRQLSDQIFGFSMTTACTLLAQKKGSKEMFSVGRVQTPLLALIVNRYNQNKSFSKIPHFQLKGIYENISFSISAASIKDHLNENNLCLDKNFLEELKNNLTGKMFQTSITEKEKLKNPPLPFNLLDLQSYANKKKGLLPDQVLDITQSLRDKHQAITYNRSDCSYLSEAQYKLSSELIDDLQHNIEIYRNLDLDKNIKSKAFDDSKITAHTAIIPVKYADISIMNENEKFIYLALCERFLLQFMKPFKYSEIKATATFENYTFQATAKKTIDAGFKNFLKDTDENEENEEENNENNYQILKNLIYYIEFNSFEIKELETKPPAIFTVSTLLDSMKRVADFITNEKTKKLLKLKDEDKKDENGSLGTPATRHTFIKLLEDRGYITIEKNKVLPTEKGSLFIQQLPKEISDPDITAILFEKQLLIEKHELSVEDFINYFYKLITRLIEVIERENTFELLATKEEGICSCPICVAGEIINKEKVAKCNQCDFVVFKTMASKKLSDSVIKELLTTGATKKEVKGFTSKANKEFNACLKLNKETKRIEFNFNNTKK